MSYRDFIKYFSRVEICNLSPETMDDDADKKWKTNMFDGEWVRGITAGGCRNFLGKIIDFQKVPFVCNCYVSVKFVKG